MASFHFVALFKLKIKITLMRSAESAPSISHFQSEKTREQLTLAVQSYSFMWTLCLSKALSLWQHVNFVAM